MNFLEICQDAALEMGIDGGPQSVDGQTGELGNVVRWVKKYYNRLQGTADGNLRYLRHEFTMTTAQGKRSYDYTDCTDLTSNETIDRFSKWRLSDRHRRPKAYLESGGIGAEYFLTYLAYEDFCQTYLIGNNNTLEATPYHITEDPQRNLLLGPIPFDTFIVTGEYFRSPQILVNDEDIPEIPLQFHDLLSYGALISYGGFEDATEIPGRIKREHKDLLRQFKNHQTERLRKGRPLA